MKTLAVIFLASILSFANILEQKAYSAYLNKNYKKALALYTKSAKEGNLKSLLMVGLFLEKGYGTKQNISKAKKIYKIVIKKAVNNKKLINFARNRLNILKNNFATNLKKEQLNKNGCYSNIPKKYIKEAKKFSCDFFKKYPDRMRVFIELSGYKLEILKHNEIDERLERQIANTISPIIKDLKQKLINCYQSAQYNIDIQACNYDFLKTTDKFLFSNNALKYEKIVYEKNEPVYKLDADEKNDLITNLIDNFNKEINEKIYLTMIQ